MNETPPENSPPAPIAVDNPPTESHPSPGRKRKRKRKKLTARERQRINKANAQHSTGPRTPEGKKSVSMNAYKHGFRIEEFALLDEKAPELGGCLEEILDHYQPTSPIERILLKQAAMSSIQL